MASSIPSHKPLFADLISSLIEGIEVISTKYWLRKETSAKLWEEIHVLALEALKLCPKSAAELKIGLESIQKKLTEGMDKKGISLLEEICSQLIIDTHCLYRNALRSKQIRLPGPIPLMTAGMKNKNCEFQDEEIIKKVNDLLDKHRICEALKVAEKIGHKETRSQAYLEVYSYALHREIVIVRKYAFTLIKTRNVKGDARELRKQWLKDIEAREADRKIPL